MRYRKLRIAWSVAWGMVAVLLCVLWVRSYSRADDIFFYRPSMKVNEVESDKGWIVVGCIDYSRGSWNPGLGLGWESDIPGNRLVNPRWTLYFNGVEDWGSCFPHWLPLVVAAAIAVVPWKEWIQRRFSLRTLLIATTLVAVVLGPQCPCFLCTFEC